MIYLVLRIYQLTYKYKLSILIQSQTLVLLLSGMYGKEDFGQKCAASQNNYFFVLLWNLET